MRNPRSSRKFWILLLAPVVLNCAKDIAGGDPNAPDIQLSVSLENLDTPALGENIHILGPGEFFSPSNRLTPGGPPRVLVITMRRNEEASFQAGRDGSNIGGPKKCKCSTACPPKGGGTVQTGNPRVTWSGSALACPGW